MPGTIFFRGAKTKFICIILLTFFLITGFFPAADAVTPLDTLSIARDMTVDASGGLHLVYVKFASHDSSEYGLYYARKSAALWNIQPIPDTHVSDKIAGSAVIMLDGTGRIHIAHMEYPLDVTSMPGSGVLKYFSADSANPSSWEAAIVDSGLNDSVAGDTIGMSVAPDNSCITLRYPGKNGAVKKADNCTGAWVTEITATDRNYEGGISVTDRSWSYIRDTGNLFISGKGAWTSSNLIRSFGNEVPSAADSHGNIYLAAEGYFCKGPDGNLIEIQEGANPDCSQTGLIYLKTSAWGLDGSPAWTGSVILPFTEWTQCPDNTYLDIGDYKIEVDSHGTPYIFYSTPASCDTNDRRSAIMYSIGLSKPELLAYGTLGAVALDLAGNANILYTDESGSLVNIIKPVFRLPLQQGWNFISVPFQPKETAVTAVFSDILPKIKIIWGYDNQNKQWQKYKGQGSSSTGQEPNTLTAMEAGKGYWIYMEEGVLLSMTDCSVLTSTAVTLYDGWNLIGYNGSDGADTDIELAKISGQWTLTWSWAGGEWKARKAADSSFSLPYPDITTFNHGRAYWVKKKQGTGSIDWLQ